jgi:hypothetical protein
MVVGKKDEPYQHNSYDDHGEDYKVAGAFGAQCCIPPAASFSCIELLTFSALISGAFPITTNKRIAPTTQEKANANTKDRYPAGR